MLYRAGWHHPTEGGFASHTLSRMLGAARCRVMMLGEQAPLGAHPILVFQASDEAGQRAMNEALRLALITNQELLVLLPRGSEQEERARTAVESWSARQGRRSRCISFENEDIATLVALLRRERAGALVLPREHALLSGVAGERLLEASDTALIVVP
ncbi:hypothetical protein [Pistricoccus aurantiacus]|uniref:hypothetical protein n=1 Tax=Pistricoccus aurantiacus TaxID=1883414 RepID=UPI003633D302